MGTTTSQHILEASLFNTLPTDRVYRILDFLPLTSLLTMLPSVCRFFAKICSEYDFSRRKSPEEWPNLPAISRFVEDARTYSRGSLHLQPTTNLRLGGTLEPREPFVRYFSNGAFSGAVQFGKIVSLFIAWPDQTYAPVCGPKATQIQTFTESLLAQNFASLRVLTLYKMKIDYALIACLSRLNLEFLCLNRCLIKNPSFLFHDPQCRSGFRRLCLDGCVVARPYWEFHFSLNLEELYIRLASTDFSGGLVNLSNCQKMGRW
jgi:hypothetical protein